jgi:ABC-type bacteriocin/lantibiotic exporter with double-glycine peptidase domain
MRHSAAVTNESAVHDEPTSYLDASPKLWIVENLWGAGARSFKVTVGHNSSLTSRTERVCALDDEYIALKGGQ